MGWLIVVVGLVGASALAANAILNALVRVGGFVLALGVFAVSSAGAVAAGLLLSMITSAWVGELPPSNIVWPCVTWSLISISALIAGSGRPVHFAARAAPWLLLGGFTMLGSIAHPRNFFSAIVIALVGIAYGSEAGQAAASVDGANQGGTTKVRRGLAPAIGPYHLDMKTADVSRLAELTSSEKAALGVVIGFKNERIYHAESSAIHSGEMWTHNFELHRALRAARLQR